VQIERPSFGDPVGPLALSSRSGITFVAVADTSATIKLYKVQTTPAFGLHLLATLKSPDRAPLIALAFDRDATRLAAATADQTIELWDLASIGRALATMNLASDFSSSSPQPSHRTLQR
jgi:WD40 repeat protein